MCTSISYITLYAFFFLFCFLFDRCRMSFMKHFVLQTRQMQKAAERTAAFERGTYVTTSHDKDVVETEKKKKEFA